MSACLSYLVLFKVVINSLVFNKLFGCLWSCTGGRPVDQEISLITLIHRIKAVDRAEGLVEAKLWPVPSYAAMLLSVQVAKFSPVTQIIDISDKLLRSIYQANTSLTSISHNLLFFINMMFRTLMPCKWNQAWRLPKIKAFLHAKADQATCFCASTLKDVPRHL
jgi:hypothetical protein